MGESAALQAQRRNGFDMRISIAMATYNGAKYLQEQLDSFVAQTRLPDELVVCDDVSSDETMEILQRFADGAPFEVRIVRNTQNLGFVRNFEKAMRKCSGDIILLSDQDDVWFPEKIAIVQKEFLDDPMIMSTINDMVITDADLKHQNVTQLDNIRSTGFGEHRFIAGCCQALRKNFLDTLYPFPAPEFTHDGWLSDMSVSFGVRKLIDKPLQFYRRHGLNASHWQLSKVHKVSLLKTVLEAGLASPIEGWTLYVERNRIHQTFIIQNRLEFERIGLAERVEPTLRQLRSEAEVFKNRIHLLSLPRYRRWLSVIGFWGRGGYHRFAGWKSAVKDMIRP
jgi:glycosyltransferase involved in cell wall biosynthesis